MSFVDSIVKNKPDKYQTLIESKVLAKQLELKVKQYNVLQTEYNDLVRKQTIDRKPASGGNESLKGRLKQLSAAGKDWLWGVNSGDGIYTCRKPCTDSNWTRIAGGLTQIEGGDKEVWGVNSVNNIYKMNQDHSNNWKYIPGKLNNISQGGGWVWGVNSSNTVYRCKQPCDGKWILDTAAPLTSIDYKYLGNWKDGGDRRLPKFGGSGYSKASCNKYCKDTNYKYFGLQFGNGHSGECWCGNNWSQATSLGKCGGNTTTGGRLCNSIYDVNNKNTLVINVGSSRSSYIKTIDLPHNDMIVSPWPLNNQNKRWGDRFDVKVSGTKLTVTRLDANVGWGQKLKLEGIVDQAANNPSLVQLSCSNTHVYGLDTDKRAWRKNIDGSGEWSRFGNPNNWQFLHINASSSNGKILAVNMSRVIVETDKNGTAKWKRSSSAGGASGINTVSGDSQNEDFYFTNTNDQIYRNSPITSGGSWTDIKNSNYMAGVAGPPKQSNENWKYLGQTNNLTECKIKAVEDKENEFSSIVYTTTNGNYNKTCYGGIKGGVINPIYTKGMTTSLAPNGTSRLGGDEGQKMLNQMKKFQDEIQDLTKKAAEDNIGLERSKSSINSTKLARNKELEQLVERLRTDRVQINKLLREPDDIASAEDSNFQQESNYYVYFLWILLVIISLFMASHIITTDGENITTITYVFVSIWILILLKYYSKLVSSYGVSFWNYISTLLVDPL